MKAIFALVTSLLITACATTRTDALMTPQQHVAYDSLFQGCLDQRLYDTLHDYLDKQLALVQVGNTRYESFLCDCTAEGAAKRPYIASMFERMKHGEELNDDGQRVLKNASFAALLQCTSEWLDKSAAVITNQLGSDVSAKPTAP